MIQLKDRLLVRPSIMGGLMLVVSCGWVMVTNWGPLAHGHPSYLVLYLGLLASAVVVLVRGLAGPSPSRKGWSAVMAIGLFLASLFALWLSPFEAEGHAIAALEEPEGSRAVESWTSILLEPEIIEPELGVVFFPGARVDARAYSEILMPVAKAGYKVVIVKEPLGIAFLSWGFVDSLLESHPEIRHWVAGGHSLGGVAASSQAVAESTSGLLLWASYPASDISDATSLHVASVYGTNDGLTVPERISESSVDLPASTRFYEIDGAIHSHFGDYGSQPGDGLPSVGRQTAQRQIVEATLAFLKAVSAR